MNIVQRIHKSSFLKQNATLFIGTLLVSILNYLYYPILGRLLNLQDYGEVQVLVSFFLQLMMFLMVFTQVTTNIVANYDDESKKYRVIFELEKLALIVSFALLVIGSLLSWQVMQALQFQSPLPFIVLLVAFMVTVPFTFCSGYLRGKQKFVDVSIGSMLGSAGKIIASAALVVLGFGTIGAIGGLVVAQIIALIYTIQRARKWGFAVPERVALWKLPNMKLIAPELRYCGLVLAGSLAVTIMYSVDVILVKYYFTPDEAGLYAAVATVGRILFVLTISISQVLMPAVKIRNSLRENNALLYKSLLLVVGLGGAALLVLSLFPLVIMEILMGSKYLEYAYLLPLLSLAIFLISILNVFTSYHLALRRYGVGIVTVSGAIITCGLIMTWHTTLTQVVQSILYGSIITLGLLAVWTLSRGLRALKT